MESFKQRSYYFVLDFEDTWRNQKLNCGTIRNGKAPGNEYGQRLQQADWSEHRRKFDSQQNILYWLEPGFYTGPDS